MDAHTHTRVNSSPTAFIPKFVLTARGDETEMFMQTDGSRWKQTLDNHARKPDLQLCILNGKLEYFCCLSVFFFLSFFPWSFKHSLQKHVDIEKRNCDARTQRSSNLFLLQMSSSSVYLLAQYGKNIS